MNANVDFDKNKVYLTPSTIKYITYLDYILPLSYKWDKIEELSKME